ncbi:hypothetical protein FB45DRAFT_395032 [Roridomyces roridus]|uniref:Fe2OG dioxygenase domain-containing protein n=1 Tax=Roridomyces roridus TaxID=1738132 RepID=A0AAD7B2E6_9AGAR|nr:hypothetical protein FB45DRAFT_395032 [Roridomyces roridus]
MDTAAASGSPSPDMSKYRVPESDACYYIPDFITVEEEEYLIRKIQDSPPQRWKQLSNRRLQLWGGELTSKNVLVAQPLPSFVDTYPDIIGRLEETGVFAKSTHGKPNHIIMNEYLPGQGIMPHQDGPAYFPVVSTLSLGSHTMFHYYRYSPDEDEAGPDAKTGTGRSIDPSPVLSLLLEPRSLVISERALYTEHLHAIREVKEDLIAPGDIPTVADLHVP